jgi:beta-lactamase class A
MKEVKRYLDSRIGEYSFYFEDLNSGYVYAHNENVVMTAAGCIKLPIAMSLLKCIEKGELALNDKINITEKDMVYGKGIIHEFSEREYSVSELMVAMLIQGDNTAANKIIDIVGIERINLDIQNLNLLNTKLNRKTMDERMKKSDVENLSTSKDLSKCWKSLYNASFLNKENSRILIEILKRQQIKNKIAFYLPESEKLNLASKSGHSDSIENDTSLLLTKKGCFIFTVMSKDLPNNVYGEVTITRMGKMMWDIINTNWNYKEKNVEVKI